MSEVEKSRLCRATPALTAVLAVWAASATVATAMVPPAPGQRWALIVGREQGSGTRVTQELGKLGQDLRQHYGYAPANVVELYEQDATVDNLRRQLFTMAEKVQPADSLFLYLSLPFKGTGEDVFLVTHGGKETEPWTLMPAYELQKVLYGLQARSAFIIMPTCTNPTGQRGSPFFQNLAYSRGSERALFVVTFCPGAQEMDDALAALATRLRAALQPNGPAAPITPQEIWGRMQAGEPPIQVEFVRSPPSGPPDAFAFEIQQGRLDPLLDALTRAASAKEKDAAIGALVAAVRDEPAQTRPALAEAVGGALLPIIGSAGDGRLRAVLALGEIGYHPAVATLGQVRGSSSDAVLRKAALDALVRIGGDATLPHLAEALGDADASVRTAAVRSLGARRYESSFPELMALTRDPDESVKVAALQAIATFPGHQAEAREAAEAMLGDAGPTPRREAASVLGGLGPPTSRAIVRVLASDPDPRVRQAAAYSVGRSFTEADRRFVEPALVQAAQTSNTAELREAAIWTLGQIGGPTAERRLRTALGDVDVRVRRTAAEKLGERKATGVVPDLVRLVEDPKADQATRVAAVTALGAIGDSRAVRPLLVALKDPNVYVRSEAEKALALLKAPPTSGEAVRLLKDPSPRVRAEAAGKLGDARDPAVTPRLIEVLNDNDNEVRQAAVGSLARHRSPGSVRQLTEALKSQSFQTRQGAVAALGLMGEVAVAPLLLDRLQDSSGAVRAEAVRSLGKLGKAEEPAVLQATEDRDPSVRLALIETLTPLKSPDAVNTLRKLARDPTPEVRSAAIVALGTPIK